MAFFIHPDHIFRHANELINATHGGYLRGHLQLPQHLWRPFFIELTIIPHSGSNPLLLLPNLFHVTQMERGRAMRKSTVKKTSWKVRIRVENNDAVVIEDGKEVKFDNCVRDGRLYLGEDGPLLTIIIPKQSGATGVQVMDVLFDRLPDSQLSVDADQMFKACTRNRDVPDAHLEMHRCRIQAEFLSMDGQVLCPPVVSTDVCNVKHPDVGAIMIHAISDPRAACHKGGGTIVVTSHFKFGSFSVRKDGLAVRAVFVLEYDGVHHMAETIYPGFNQIVIDHKTEVYQSSMSFKVPPQDPQVVHQLRGKKLQIALYRDHDRRFGNLTNAPCDFVYFFHEDNYCPSCYVSSLVRVLSTSSSSIAPIGPARINHRRRNTELPSSSGTSPNDSSDDSLSPPPKVPRVHYTSTSSDEDPEPNPTETDQDFPDFGQEVGRLLSFLPPLDSSHFVDNAAWDHPLKVTTDSANGRSPSKVVRECPGPVREENPFMREDTCVPSICRAESVAPGRITMRSSFLNFPPASVQLSTPDIDEALGLKIARAREELGDVLDSASSSSSSSAAESSTSPEVELASKMVNLSVSKGNKTCLGGLIGAVARLLGSKK